MLVAKDLYKSFGGVRALAGFSFCLSGSEILGLIGPNGAGKTTLFNVVTGFARPDRGDVVFKNADVIGMAPRRIACLGIARTFQDLRLIRRMSVLDNVMLCFRDQAGESLTHALLRMESTRKIENANREVAVSLLDEVGLGDRLHQPAEALSYGQQKLLSLACCLVSGVELLLLDEPVAGIAPELTSRILTIIQGLPKRGKSVILIEHNIDAVMKVCDRVIFMDAGIKVSEGSPDAVRNDPKVIEAYLD